MTGIYFKTFGCSINFSESEIMKALLKKAQFELVNNPEDAFVIIFNICTVKGDTTALRAIRKIKEAHPNKKIIVAGCITKAIISKIREIVPDASLISTHNITEIVSVVEETINDSPVEILTKSNEEKINLPKIRKNKVIGIVPISSGCVGYCAYCSVKMVKGKLHSYPKEKIIEEINKCLRDGCKEIWLTSQDTGCYGKDINSSLIDLAKTVLEIPGEFIVRIGMMNPNHALEMLDNLIDIYRNKKVFKFLHIPVQSGNNQILEKMKRLYKVEDFKTIVKRFREVIPEICISTDIICGFPGETKEQFNDSLQLIKDICPDVLNISRFIARPGTDAYKMKDKIEGEETKRRSRLITGVFDWVGFEANKKWKNWQGIILIDEKGKNNSFVGRNYCYRPIVVKGNFNLGEKTKVKIIDITKHYLIGEEINA